MSTLRVTVPVALNAIEFRKVANASAGRAHLAAPTRLTRPAGNPTPYGGNTCGRRGLDCRVLARAAQADVVGAVVAIIGTRRVVRPEGIGRAGAAGAGAVLG